MQRRAFLGAAVTSSLWASLRAGRWDDAVAVLERATTSKQVDAAVLHVVHKNESFTRPFGKAASGEAMFLLGSISKPINVTAVMTLFDQGKFQLDDRVKKFLPAFKGDGRDDVTVRHLLTHVSGLPDQLANNNELRKRHAPLTEFAAQTVRARLEFAPGTRYQYSSMGILLAARIAELITGADIRTFVERSVFQPLGLKHSAQGLGRFKLTEMIPCQMEGAAPESGGGDPTAKEWDWNSSYWRQLGAPWGGTHASAPDIARILSELMGANGKVVKPETARLMITNHNPKGFTPRGLGFGVGKESGSPGCSERTFGHTGSTGTLCWADPASETICVVLTSLPRRASQRHPRELAANAVAAAVRQEPATRLETPVTVATSPKAGGHIHPSLCQAQDGTLVVVYKGPQVLMRTRSTDGGKTWEQPEAIATTAKRPDVIRDTKTFEVYPGTADTLPDGRLLVTWNYIADDKAKDRYYERALLYTLSEDRGRTWSDQQLIGPVAGKHLGAVRHNVLAWKDGRWLLPIRSLPPRLFDPKSRESEVFPLKGPDEKQHAFQQIVRTTRGTLLAMGPVFLRSTDEGRTWTTVANFPAAPDGDNAEGRYLTVLSGGRVLVTWGVGTANKGLRYNFSADDGKTWNTGHKVTLLPEANIAARYYSARTIQIDDKHVGTVYLSGSTIFFLPVAVDRLATGN